MSLRYGEQKDWWTDPALARKLEEYDFIVASYDGVIVTPGWNRANCAQCEDLDGTEDYKASLGFNTNTQGYNCYKCGAHGRLPDNYAAQLLDDAGAIEDVVLGDGESEEVQPVEQPYGLTSALDVDWALHFLTGPKGDFSLGAQCRALSRQCVEEACVGCVPHPVAGQMKLRNRVIVPVPDYFDPSNPLRGWVARDVTGKALAPYLNSRNMQRDEILFNEPALYVQTDDPVFVVEGTMDALRLWPNAVAVLGKPIPPHVDLILGAKRPVVIMLDGDAWEDGRAFALMIQFKDRKQAVQVGNLKLPPKVDPDDYGYAHGWDFIREAGLRTIS